ncbi:MAG: 6-pyruvoyl tetrahydropterin synthase family protein [Fidelibacterota bacterium]
MPFITKSFRFSASHQYGNPAWSLGKNREVFGHDVRLHGHDYDLEVTVKGRVDPETGFVANLVDLKIIVSEKVLDVLDHCVIDQDIPWFEGKQPSCENLVIWIWEQIEPAMENVTLHRVRVRETPTIYADYFGPEG